MSTDTITLSGTVEAIHLSGTVQGVGLRPCIWRLAQACGIDGYVVNEPDGVTVMARATAAQLDAFVERIIAEAPAPARIDAIARKRMTPGDTALAAGFTIRAGRGGSGFTDIATDAATCPACLAEINDPGNRRHRYPFTNCTRCGPRYSIINTLPYDRANTTMAAFTMCTQCEAEYRDPADRRYHAQANACPDCGPRLWLEDWRGQRIADSNDDCLTQAVHLLQEGTIIAIKGLGGIHLACDAGNSDAIDRLRRIKQRPHRALALMARDVAMVRDYAEVDGPAVDALQQAAAPIVVMPAIADNGLPDGIAPGQATLGFMLPYTPLHHLLMQQLQRPLVMTSANGSGEPLLSDNDLARRCLSGSVDYLLLHDRDIRHRCDDSVVRIMAGAPRPLRRARGYAPQVVDLPDGFDRDVQVLAMGGQQKTTFCLVRQGRAVLSPHIGDLDGAETCRDYRQQVAGFCRLFNVAPTLIAVDRHPDYRSTRLGEEIATERVAGLDRVQHHHAHIAAVMVEHGLPHDTPPLLGIALDGAGYGDDGTIWGGEFLCASYTDYTRIGHFRPVPLPGGAAASREPWRNTFAQLTTQLDWGRVAETYADVAGIRFLRRQPLSVLQAMMARGINSPLTSSAGRLFDAVAAFVGIRSQSMSYEGQAAMELEALAASLDPRGHEGRGYGYTLSEACIDWTPLWSGLLDDGRDGTAREVMAARFHQTVIEAVTAMALRLSARHRLDTVVLGGGVFQNRLLLQGICRRLQRQGMTVLMPLHVPANDGGLALGQAAVALARIRSDTRHGHSDRGRPAGHGGRSLPKRTGPIPAVSRGWCRHEQ